ncbi:ankyrin repeat and SAM domain-containing protein 6 [Nilaparvata lugens]|uniref:ankyrin repeat and SAM domain-containing protein 6 n=1 Tax=Nilaparvata lugens TaxID=108931 RepID=UPI00193CF177|nr:ankyrin repeat and SAM domain-containing protein 6 [Nilaparvata lugens]
MLLVAVGLGNETIVKYLLKFGADPLKTNSKGETAEMIAAKNEYQGIVTIIQFRVSAVQNLQKLLQYLSLDKYWPIMIDNNIDMDKFLTLTEADLQSLGVNLLGPRRKMSMAITSLNALRQQQQNSL